MSQISLKKFTGQIRQRIDEERASEAIPMAQYLLRQYPRYLKGYELLAEAALQQGNIKDAIEVFRRVLSADPENLIAYRGMAAAYAEEEEISEALWYMMRAFERDPRVRGIRQELRDLYQQRDGRRPGRLNLNRAALARMYMREGLYNRAIEELNIELESGPHGPASDRVDLSIALAQAQWFANQRSEAARTAQKVRLELPYCLKANLILAEFYAQQGDLTSADIHLRIAQQMDPENDLAVELFGDSGYLQPNQIMIESLEEAWKTAQPGSDEEHKMPDWLADLSLFATAEPQDQEVDWNAIIAYETDWRTILAKTTHEAISNFVPNWRVDLRNATRLSLSKRQDEQAESAILEVAEQRLPLILEPREQPLSPILDLEKDLPSARTKAFDTPSDTPSEPPSTPLPDVVPPQLVTPDWRETLQEATSQALKDTPPAQAKQEPPSDAIKEEELALGQAWKEELRAETEPWLDKVESKGQPEAIEPLEPFIIPPAPIIEPERSWISSLTATTRAELEAVEQVREAAKSPPEAIEPVEPAKAAWVTGLREESQEAAMPLTEELAKEAKASTPSSPAALDAETEALLAKRQEVATPTENKQEVDTEDKLSLPIELVPELPTYEPEEEAAIETMLIPLPAEAAWTSALREETEEQLEAFSIGTTPWAIALRGATEAQLESLSVADTAWATALRDDSQRQLEALSAGTTAWATALRRDTALQLESLSAAETAWVKGLRHLTEQQLLTLSSDGSAWAKNLRQETKNVLRWMDEGNKGWISALQDDSQDALSAYEEAHRPPQVPIEVVEEEPSRKEDVSWLLPEEEPQVITPTKEVSPQAPDIIAPVESGQEPAITTPVEPSQSDFIASLMAAAEKVAGDDEQLSEVAEDFWDDIEVQDSESLPEYPFGSTEERAMNEPIAPPIAPPIKEGPKAREERLTQPPSRSKRVSEKEVVPQKEAIKAPARPAPIKESPQKERKADKVPVVEEKAGVPAPSDEWQTARWLWESKQDKEALAIYQRFFDERQAPNEKLEEELSAWTKTGKASALAYQLLGDLYRRMGRMQDAVAQYREAINRM